MSGLSAAESVLLYSKYQGSIQRTLNVDNSVKLGSYVRVVKVQLGSQGVPVFSVERVHEPAIEKSSLRRGAPAVLLKQLLTKFGEALLDAIREHKGNHNPGLGLHNKVEDLQRLLLAEYSNRFKGVVSPASEIQAKLQLVGSDQAAFIDGAWRRVLPALEFHKVAELGAYGASVRVEIDGRLRAAWEAAVGKVIAAVNSAPADDQALAALLREMDLAIRTRFRSLMLELQKLEEARVGTSVVREMMSGQAFDPDHASISWFDREMLVTPLSGEVASQTSLEHARKATLTWVEMKQKAFAERTKLAFYGAPHDVEQQKLAMIDATKTGIEQLVQSRLMSPEAALLEATAELAAEAAAAFHSLPQVYAREFVRPMAESVSVTEQDAAKWREKLGDLEAALKTHERLKTAKRTLDQSQATVQQRRSNGQAVPQKLARAVQAAEANLSKLQKTLSSHSEWKTTILSQAAGQLDLTEGKHDLWITALTTKRRTELQEALQKASEALSTLKVSLATKEAAVEGARLAVQKVSDVGAIHEIIADWAGHVRSFVLPLQSAPTHQLQLQMMFLPSSWQGQLVQLVFGHAEPLNLPFAAHVKRLLSQTLEQVAFACSTGSRSECSLCQDLCFDLASRKTGDEVSGMAHLCLWSYNVCGACESSCWKRGQPREILQLHELCLQPLPAFMWLGLQEDADSSQVSNSFRSLSRTHHPDRGGSSAAWEVTKACHALLREQTKVEGKAGSFSHNFLTYNMREAYILGRNHEEFVRQSAAWDEEALSTKQRLQRMQVARAEAHTQAKQAKLSKLSKLHEAADSGDAAAVATRKAREGHRERAGHEARAIVDLDSLIPQMPSVKLTLVPAIPKDLPDAARPTHLLKQGRYTAPLRIEWPARLSERLEIRLGGHYKLEHQTVIGRQVSEWSVIYSGPRCYTYQIVEDSNREYMTEHHFRVAAVTQEWQSLWSMPTSIVLNLLEESGPSAEASQRFSRLCGFAIKQLGEARRGALGLGELERLSSTLVQLKRMQGTLAKTQRLRGEALPSKQLAELELETTVHEVEAQVRALQAAACRADALQHVKAVWRARLVEEQQKCTTHAQAQASLHKLSTMALEVPTFVTTALGEYVRERAVSAKHVHEFSDEEERQLGATLTNMTSQFRTQIEALSKACLEAESKERQKENRAEAELRKRVEQEAVERMGRAEQAEAERARRLAPMVAWSCPRCTFENAPSATDGRASFTYELLHRISGGFMDAARLGSGASGTVFRAALPSGTPVAIKRFNPDASHGTSGAWHTELVLLSATTHFNIVPLLGASSDGPALCLVYQFCDGGSLEQRLARTLPGLDALIPSQRLFLLSDVVRGLAHLHGMGLVHRDIKPANILLQKVQSGLLGRIGDFGIARMMEAEAKAAGSKSLLSRSRTMQTAQAAGTLTYMAPEYLKFATCSTKVDSFAFGLTILVVLTGAPAEQPVRASGVSGEEVYDNLLECFYEELWEEPEGLLRLLDRHAAIHGESGVWDEYLETARMLHGLAKRCLEHTKGRRAEVRELLPPLEAARAADEARLAAPRIGRHGVSCPLSLEPMHDPVVASDGQTYERAHIERWLAAHDVSPVTNLPLAHKHLAPNLALKQLIDDSATASVS